MSGAPSLPVGYDWLADNAIERNLFFEPAFLAPAMLHLAARHKGAPVGICAATDPEDGIVRAALPVTRAKGRYGPLPTPTPLMAWVHEYAPLGLPLISPENPVDALATLLDKAERWDGNAPVLLLPMVKTDGQVWALLEKAAAATNRRLTPLHTWPRAGVRLDPTATADASLRTIIGKKGMQAIKASEKRLKASGRITQTWAESPEAIGTATATFLTLEANGWKGEAGTAFRALGLDRFALDVMQNLAKQRRARVDRVVVENDIGETLTVAATLSLQAGTNEQPLWMPWKTAYSEAHRAAAPGSLGLSRLTQNLLKMAQDNQTAFELDSLADPGSVIARRLWKDQWPMADIVVDLKPGGSGAYDAILLAEKARRSVRAAAKAGRDRMEAVVDTARKNGARLRPLLSRSASAYAE